MNSPVALSGPQSPRGVPLVTAVVQFSGSCYCLHLDPLFSLLRQRREEAGVRLFRRKSCAKCYTIVWDEGKSCRQLQVLQLWANEVNWQL